MSEQSELPEFSHQIDGDQIKLTANAAGKVSELIHDAGGDFDAVRIFVSGGGCSGMTYGMTFAGERVDSDSVLELSGIKLFVDPVALNYLTGCEVDFVDDGANATFVFNNVFRSVGGSGSCGGCGGSGF